MLPINQLDCPNGIFYDLPLGKPDKNQMAQVGEETRDRVIRKADTDNTCWYSALGFIRHRIGANHPPELKEARRFEKIGSERAKELRRFERSLPAVLNHIGSEEASVLARMTVQKASLIWSLYRENIELIAASGEGDLGGALKEFIRENRPITFEAFLIEKKLNGRREINARFLQKIGVSLEEIVDREYTKAGYSEPWGDLTPDQQSSLLDCFIMKESANQYGLRETAWSPRKPIESLKEELKEHGPLFLCGMYGSNAYKSSPFKLRQTLAGKEIYGWKPGDRRVVRGGHAILIVGARVIESKGYVYFIDPADASDPSDVHSQKVYIMSYGSLTENIADLHGFLTSLSSPGIGYGYTGNFKLR